MLRRHAPRASTAIRRNVVVFAVGDRRLAVPAPQIVEVARIASYTPVPCEDPANLGVVLHRDELLPLVDLGARLGARGTGLPGLPGLCLFVRTDFGEVGFPIDRVLGLEPSSDGTLREGVTLLDPSALGGPHGQGTAD